MPFFGCRHPPCLLGSFEKIESRKNKDFLLEYTPMNVNLRAYVLTSAKTKMEVILATVREDMKQVQMIALLAGLQKAVYCFCTISK